MSIVIQSMRHSVLLGPMIRLAATPHETISRWVRNARLFGWVKQPAESVLSILPGNRTAGLKPYFAFLPVLAAAGLFVSFTTSSTGVIGAAAIGLLGLTLLGGMLFRVGWHQHITIIDVLVGLFFLSALVSAGFSSYARPSLIGLAKMGVFFGGYVAFRALAQTTGTGFIILLHWLVALALGQVLIGYDQYVNHIQPLATWVDPTINPELRMTRIFGSIQPHNPNLLAGFLIPCFAAAAGLSLFWLRKKTWLFSLLLAGAALAILWAIVMTGSRGGYLAIAGMLATFFAIGGHLLWHDESLKHYRWLKALWMLSLISGIAAVILAVAASPALQNRIASMFAGREDSSISYRFNVYASAWRMFLDNPVVGIGPGNQTFKLVYGLYMVPGYNALAAYSVPLEIAVEQGVIGLAAFLLLLLVLKFRAALFVDGSRPLPEKIMVMLLFTGVVGSFVYGLFDTIWYRPAVNLMFWFFVAGLGWYTERMLAHER